MINKRRHLESHHGMGGIEGEGNGQIINPQQNRRAFLSTTKHGFHITSFLLSLSFTPAPIIAYDADPDAYRESLYLLSRIQEATCLQQRYIQKKNPPIIKMKLTLRLVDKSYRVLDQITYISKFLDADDLVRAAQVGNEAAEALSDAIDFVNTYASKKQDASTMTTEQREFLESALVETRQKLFEFLEFVDQKKLEEARLRVEEENKLNREEFDPDLLSDSGVLNPIVLPWKVSSSNLKQ